MGNKKEDVPVPTPMTSSGDFVAATDFEDKVDDDNVARPLNKDE